ncbi:MAG: hypothetical protein P4L85_13315 [Paludisphaera borealis]|uniref:hypothetical protein n=1 Tax=Paludisphaera borealis TaxID=1387353 RepID=UPI00284C9997|nr:hypothetical protein [Paludisphaera borealis]MDR3620324.1 hypothetical protein [Paludisphaera borealis]
MGDDTSKSRGATSTWPLPAAVIAMLTFLGFSNLPGTQQSGSTPARNAAPGAASPADDTPIDTLLDAHLFGDGRNTEEEHREKITILAPLLRFYAPRLARLEPTDRSLLAKDPKYAKSPLDPSKVVAWMIDPAKTHDDLKVLVCMVPDPSLSGSAYSFDSAITALLLALRNTRYVLDGYQIDWRGPSGRRVEVPTSTPASGTLRLSLSTPGAGARLRQPGVMLLRRMKLSDGNTGEEKIQHELVMLLLVPETPIVGVDTGIFQTSLDIAAEFDGRHPPGPVRIIGPSFSGSVSSVVRALKSWLDSTKPPAPAKPGSPLRIHWINGTALSLDVDAIQAAFSSSASRDEQVVRLESVIYGYVDLLTFALKFLREYASPLVPNNRIAFLTEETTGYGASLRGSSVPADAGFDAFRFTFPAQIAEMRRRYARQDQGSASSSHLLRTAERLRFEEEESEKSEFIRPESPSFTSASDELRLLRVAEQINSLDIRFVYLSATDVRDRLFVAEFIRANCPDAMVVLPQAEPAFTHKETIGQLRGITFASTYPMWIHHANRREPILTLPEHSAYGVYNAAIAQLCELATPGDEFERCQRQLADYGWDDRSGRRGPAVWMTVSSQKGHLPLAVDVPQEPKHQTGPGRYAASIWRPSGGDSPLRKAGASETSRELFLSRVPITSGVSWLLPFVFGVAAAALLSHCHAKSRRIREDRLVVDAHYPLPSEAVGVRLPFNSLLNQGAAKAKDLSLFAESSLGHVYRNWGLGLLGLVMFWFMYFYASFGGRNLQNRNWLVPLAVAVVIWAILRWRLLRYSNASAPSIPLTRPLFIAALFGCVIVAVVLPGIAQASLAVRSIAFTACALVCVFTLTLLAKRRRSQARGGEKSQNNSPDDERIVPTSVTLGVLIWSMLLGFLTFSASTLEPSSLLSLAMRLLLAALFGAVIHIAIYLREYWTRLDAWTESLLSLPMGDAFDRLPLRLTSRLGNFADVWTGGADKELDERLHLIRANLSRNFNSGAAHGVRVRSEDLRAVRVELESTPRAAGTSCTTRAITRLLTHVWLDRSPVHAFSDQGAKPPEKDEPKADKTESAATPSSSDDDQSQFDSLPASTIEGAETYLAIEVVRYLNRHLEILWVRVTALTVLTLILVATVNSYPFQPAGTLFQWTMFIVVLTVMVLIRVLVGFHRNALISRVNKLPTDRSLWNLDFVGKLIAYVGPVVAVFAALSVSMSDLIRLVLGPLVR